MKKIKDRVILGLTTGLIAGIPGRLINNWEYKKGFTDMRYGEMAASLFMAEKVRQPEARFIGSLTNNINVSLTGTIVTYLLSATGRDKAIIKGIGVTSVAWLAIYGLTSRLGISPQARKHKPLTHILSFKDHAVLGALCGLLASQLGDDSLFPDSKRTEQMKKNSSFQKEVDENLNIP